MSDWYYENNGERGGPVSADELRAMLACGAISLTSLVWTTAFGSEWKRLGDTELALPLPVVPPPLPAQEPPVLPPGPSQPATEPNDFLDSELTKALIGRKQDHYLAKWRVILTKAGGDPAKIATTSSWNWPALFVPYGWLLYRKLYVLGGIILAFQLAYVLLPDSMPTSVARAFMFATIGLGFVFALYGNAWYLDTVRKRWKALSQERDQSEALERARKSGGVNLVAPIAAVAVVLAAAVLPILGWEPAKALASNVSCSSKDAMETVYRIAREQYEVQTGNKADGFVLTLENIRTRNATAEAAHCAADLKMRLADDGKNGSRSNEAAMPITYLVESIDSGNRIYVTVQGL